MKIRNSDDTELKVDDLRIAIAIPSVEFGSYWRPVLYELTKICKNTIFYTGCLWPKFDADAPGASAVKLVGKFKFVEATQVSGGYGRGFMVASPKIVNELLEFKPHVVFVSAFSIWTVLALLFKPLGGWKVVIIYDGSSPNTNFEDSKLRTFSRRLMVKFTDAFIANSNDGKKYLYKVIGAEKRRIFTKTYLVPEPQALRERLEAAKPSELKLKRPFFLFVGQVISRKGIKSLLEACSLLTSQGYSDYSLVIIGDGAQREELEVFVKNNNLTERVTWTGWLDYGQLGAYFQDADVFVFPTFEDVWGMVVLEAMVFGKPILCSKGAGAYEMVIEGENGYLFESQNPEEIAEGMRRFIDNPELAASMGEKSKQLIGQYTPEAAAKSMAEVAMNVLQKIQINAE
ncbi:glycosyltransferase family 4 protein [Coleofasciculus sp. FACHB-129]|uniref:glycosyltransferase family 4 protein n=1 Tax=Cyanophyceae TaxID=3028117 RepID=UPI0016868425|nr:glycosyltransferase family 4 protein [Coleofasciculus sp. FACHB-129]MBD1895370.1 glycosyltransferase family 4 protein [Coleofasciculus sp. FACHB-129]